MKTNVLRKVVIPLVAGALTATPAYASFHIMQIEQVLGGVNGDITAQAIQLRMRSPFPQNLVSQARIRSWDAQGQNPIVLIDMMTNVSIGNLGAHVLIASPGFANFTNPSVNPDFTMTNVIPADRLAAGSITFEDDLGTVYWRLSWGGAGYTGSNAGAFTNDGDGNFGPPWPGPLPSGSLQALLFQGSAGAPSTNNAGNYALTAGAAVFTNNAGATFTVVAPVTTGACCDDLTGACTNAVEQGTCTASGGRFGGNGSDCTTINPPCLPSGACCDDSTGTCTDLVTQDQCVNVQGFRYGGDTSTCATINPPCVPPQIGACCVELTGTCTNNLTNIECGALGGRFGGDGSDCATITPSCEPVIAVSLLPVAGAAAGAALNAGGTLTSPVQVTHAGDGSGRLFIVDQAGQIRVVDGGVLLPTPFLDLSSKIVSLDPGFDERGLLGLAFHPSFATNGRFFVRYSAPRPGSAGEPCLAAQRGCHKEVISQFTQCILCPVDPNVADPTTEVVLFEVDEPEFNHDGGMIAFGPDGLLYFALGDGGGANDDQDRNGLCDAGTCDDLSVCSVSAQDCLDGSTCVSDLGACGVAASPCADGSPCLPAATALHGPIGNGQNIDSSLGAMMRIDVDSPPDPGLNFHIPIDNPFVGGSGLDLIYAYGFRNPFRFSFDDGPGGDGSLFLADVGQDLIEEVDKVVKGGNYGWVIREGAHCFDPNNPLLPPAVCPTVGPLLGDPLIDPVSEYIHPVPCTSNADCAPLGVACGGNGLCLDEGGLSVIGGFVYRGSQLPALVGKYVYGDFSDGFDAPGGGRLYYFDTTGPNAFKRRNFFLAPNGDPLNRFIKGMGEDENGEVYVCTSTTLAPTGGTGVVFRIVQPLPLAIDGFSPRYLAITVPPNPNPLGLVVTPDCPSAVGKHVGAPGGPNNIAITVDPPGNGAMLNSAQWGGTVFVTGNDIFPNTAYRVQIDSGTPGSPILSPAVITSTSTWGDVSGFFDPVTGQWPLPDGSVDVTADLIAILDRFKGRATAPIIPRVDLAGADAGGPTCLPDGTIDVIIDVLFALKAFKGSDITRSVSCVDPCP